MASRLAEPKLVNFHESNIPHYAPVLVTRLLCCTYTVSIWASVYNKFCAYFFGENIFVKHLTNKGLLKLAYLLQMALIAWLSRPKCISSERNQII